MYESPLSYYLTEMYLLLVIMRDQISLRDIRLLQELLEPGRALWYLLDWSDNWHSHWEAMDNVYSMGTVGRDNPHALAGGKDFTGVLKMVYSLLWVVCGCNSGHKPIVETGYYHAAWQIGTRLFWLLRDHSPKQISRWVPFFLKKKKKVLVRDCLSTV